MRSALADAEAEGHEAFEITTRLEGNGRFSWIKTFGRYVEDSDPPRIIGVSVDVTAENELAEARELMLSEMNHRVKNLFAMIGGILRIAARKHETTKALVDDVEGRVLALGNAHTLASNQLRSKPVEMHELVETMVAPHSRAAKIEVSKAPFPVSAACITPLTLILHEWATNAVKHGVLGKEAGNLSVDWKRTDKSMILRWNEIGDSDVRAAGDAGFGTVLLSTSARQLGATIETRVHGPVLLHLLTMPISVRHDA
jgi:two-component system, chemotaxis family, CheB/CheR fusion protein